MNISKRLKTVASFIPGGTVLADIGTDHAYLPIYVVQKGLITRAICGDVREGPVQMAMKHVQEAKLEKSISIRSGDGLEVIRPDDHVDCVTICGMGGSLIATILEKGKDRLKTVQRLILQPNNGEEFVRRWLMENNWQLVAERIIEEEGHIYEILVADRGNGRQSDTIPEKELFFGPYLLKERNQIFLMKWEREKRALHQVLQQLEKATLTDEIREKKARIHRKLVWIEEVLTSDEGS